MLAIVQIWDAQKQEVTRRVGATSRRIASKIANVLHDGKTARIVPQADAVVDVVVPAVAACPGRANSGPMVVPSSALKEGQTSSASIRRSAGGHRLNY